METPSTKVTVQFVVGLLAVVLAHLAADVSWLSFLPEWAIGPAGVVLAAVAAYIKRETNPASSSYIER